MFPGEDGFIHAIRLKPVGLLGKLLKRDSDIYQLFMIQPDSIDYVMVESTVEEEQQQQVDKTVVHGVELYG